MSLTEKIKTFIGGLGSPYDRSPLTFAQLDVEKLKAKLRLKEEATAKGIKNLPLPSTQSLDDTEQRIISVITNEITHATEAYYDSQKSFEDRITSLESDGNKGKLESVAGNAESDFRMEIQKRRHELISAHSEERSFANYLKNFKGQNDLDRPALYPPSRVLFYGIAFLLVVIETYINGIFFAKGSEYGMVQGFFTAFIPSLLNISLSCCLGNFAIRLANNKKSFKKFIGAVLCIFIPAVILFINLIVTHYRSAVVDMAGDNAAHMALQSFLAAPFSFKDVESILLLLTGCVFSLVATIDFWKMDDPYHSYGKLTRMYQKKNEAYIHANYDALEELKYTRDDRLDELDKTSNAIAAKYRIASDIFEAQKRWKVVFEEHLNTLERDANVLLAYYRGVNMAARAVPEVPKHFLKDWKLQKPSIPEPFADFTKILNNIRLEVSSAENAYAKCVSNVNDAYDAAISTFENISQLKSEVEKCLTDNDQKKEDLALAA